MPRVAILHHHLRPGGVTRVIEHAVAALEARGVACAVLTGEAPAPDAFAGTAVRVVEGMGYDDDDAPPGDPKAMAEAIRAAARDALGDEPDLYHAHNHCLGKNRALPWALHRLLSDGRPVLYQPHDFAEDGRPANYRRQIAPPGRALGEALYPLAGHAHFATLNSRDRRHLIAAGLPEARVHPLPNAIGLAGEHLPADTASNDERLFLYPTRAIRRKNLGEFLFWSAVAPEGDRFGVTLAPQNPAERPRYDAWVAFAQQQGLPVEFEVGSFANASFTQLLRSAHALVTTSVAEGFGLAFLEPWLVGRPLLGRNLPEITADFADAGIDLDTLYDRLDVPLDWIDAAELDRAVEAALRDSYRAYDRPVTPALVDRARRAFVRDDRVDFGRLDESLQQQAIGAARRPGAASEWSKRLETEGFDDPARIEHNQQRIREHYSLEGYGRRLEALYRTVAASPSESPGHVDAARVLDRFLQPESFYLLRT